MLKQHSQNGLTISAIVIAVGYAIGIFACGMFTNWNDVLSLDTVNMANVAYVINEKFRIRAWNDFWYEASICHNFRVMGC